MYALRAIAGAMVLMFLTQPCASQMRDEMETAVEEFLARDPEKLHPIIRDYLIKHPRVLREALAELMKRRSAANAEASAAIKANAEALFGSGRQVVLGNAQGDVTVVEFFDYNCGFCKRALADKLNLIASDAKLRVVLKELPILGPGSVEAARVSVAAAMQDSGARYLEFHRRLLAERGAVDQARALAVAQDAGFDAARLQADMAGGEVTATLDETAKLARSLGISGTPAYVVGDALVRGAVGAAALTEKILTVRK